MRINQKIERLERLLETERYIREQEIKGAAYDKEIMRNNHSWNVAFIGTFLLIALMIIFSFMGF
jgi:hypothetical protein